jgi:osomolarity two-component system phosphorelay intermediate protein YPD1
LYASTCILPPTTSPHLTSTQQKGPSFINLDVFNQILDMDDDEDGDEEEAFSEGIVGGFFDQAETTFASMEKALYVFTRIQNKAELNN